MKFKIVPSKEFLKDVKRLLKKYKTIKNDIDELSNLLQENPQAGIDLGRGLYKIRLKSSNMKEGKSSGFRIIYYLLVEDRKIYLLTIFPKSEKEDIDMVRLEKTLEELKLK